MLMDFDTSGDDEASDAVHREPGLTGLVGNLFAEASMLHAAPASQEKERSGRDLPFFRTIARTELPGIHPALRSP